MSALQQLLATLALASSATPSLAGEADVLAVEPHCNAARTVCRFSVTIEHADAGWEHYADLWDVLGPDGRVLGTRVLRHPHVDEQPFTRSMRAIQIPTGVGSVTIRARDSMHGYGGQTIEVSLIPPEAPPDAPRPSAPAPKPAPQ